MVCAAGASIKRQRLIELAGPAQEPRRPHPRFSRRVSGNLIACLVAVEDVGFLVGSGGAAQPLLLRDDGIGEMQPRLARTSFDRVRHEQHRAVGHEQAFERRDFGPQPRTLERVGVPGAAHARVVFGQQPAAFVTRVPIVAAERGDAELEREHRGASRRVRPRIIGTTEVAKQGREILRVREALLKPSLVLIEEIGQRLDIWRHAPRRRRGLGWR